HADDRKGRERGDRAGQMRRAAGAADDHAHAARLERVDPLAESLRGPVRREHTGFHLDAEGAERRGGESHGGLVRGRAHDDRDARPENLSGFAATYSASFPSPSATMSRAKSPSSRGSVTSASGSPKRALYSRTRQPLDVFMRPA